MSKSSLGIGNWPWWLFFTCLFSMVVSSGRLPAGETSPRILVFSRVAPGAFSHTAAISAGITAIRNMGTAKGWTVDDTIDAGQFTAGHLANYKVIIFNNTAGDVLNDSQQAAMEQFIRNGGGFVGIHAATDTEYNWPWYGELVGAYFKRHPPGVPSATINIEDTTHPSTKDLPNPWTRADEWYEWQVNPRTKTGMKILMKVDESTYAGGQMGADHPVAWCRNYDGGRSFYTALGHSGAGFSDTDFQKHLAGGIEWAASVGGSIVTDGLVLDLDADKDVTTEADNWVTAWNNQVDSFPAQVFQINNIGRSVPGSGRPRLNKNVAEINNHDSMVFEEDELICFHEDAFDQFIKGSGHTWLVVIKPYVQNGRLRDVNAFFGNLRNGGLYEGFWGCFNDDASFWGGPRNGITFGRWDHNNPKVEGGACTPGEWTVLAGRLQAGTGQVKMEVFNNSTAVAGSFDNWQVNTNANSSKLAIGTERDATNHPGLESFDGEIARLLMYGRPLTDQELAQTISSLQSIYFGSGSSFVTAAASASVTSGEAPLSVHFDASASTAQNTTIASYDWNFGDGSTGSGATPSHIYTTDGLYTAEVTVHGADGSSDTETIGIFVGAVEAGLVGYWPLDETSGTVAADQTPSGMNLTVTSGSWGTGKLGGALITNGSSTFAGGSGASQLPSGAQPLTLAAWARSDSSSGGYHMIAAFGTPSAGKAVWIGRNGSSLKAGAYGNDALNKSGVWTGDNAWHHIVMTYDGTTARLYLDGTQVNSANTNWNIQPDRVRIGNQVNDFPEFWSGAIDDVRVYDRALTAAEITGIMNSNPGPTNQAPIVNAGADQTVILPAVANLNATVTDDGLPQGATIQFAWSKVSGPGAVTFADASAEDTTAAFAGAGTYVLRLSADDGDRSASDELTVTVNDPVGLRDPENPANAVSGMGWQRFLGSWNQLPDFAALTPDASGTTNTFSLGLGEPADNFGYRYTGYVDVPADGQYTFYTTSDDGSKLYIGNTTVVDNDGLHASVEQSGSIGLKAGKHAITVEFFERSGGEVLSVSWQGPSITKQIVPASKLYRVGTTGNQVPAADAGDNLGIEVGQLASLDGSASTDPDNSPSPLTYSWAQLGGPGVTLTNPNTATPSFIPTIADTYTFRLTVFDGQDSDTDDVSVVVTTPGTLRDPENPANTVNGIDWARYLGTWSVLPNFASLTPAASGTTATFSLGLGEPADHFAYRFSGFVDVPTDGQYTFYTSSDDGSKLYIGNTTVVDNDGLHATAERNGTIGLKQGKHVIAVEFFERGGDEVLVVSWEGPGLAKQVVPASVLYRVPSTANLAPTADAGTDLSLEAGQLAALDGSGSSDPDNGPAPLTFAWTQLSGSSVSLANPNSATPSFTPATIGTYTFQLTVFDGQDSATDQVSVFVIDSTPPTLSTTSAELQGQVDGTGSTVTVTVNGAAATVNGNTWRMTVTLTTGTNAFTIVATDQGGQTTSETVSVDVTQP